MLKYYIQSLSLLLPCALILTLSACGSLIFTETETPSLAHQSISKAQFPTRINASKIAVFVQNQNSNQNPNQNSNQNHLSLLNLIKQAVSRLSKTAYMLVPQHILSDSVNQWLKSKATQNCNLSCIFEIANQQGIHELILLELIDQKTIQITRYQSNRSSYNQIAQERYLNIEDHPNEAKIQAKTLELFLKDHPNLRSKIDRLEKGFYFEKIVTDDLDRSQLKKLPPIPKNTLTFSPQSINEKLGDFNQEVNLENLNLSFLEKYEATIQMETQPNLQPFKKKIAWQELLAINPYPKMANLIETKISDWSYQDALWFEDDLRTVKQRLEKWRIFQQNNPHHPHHQDIQKRISELQDWQNQADLLEKSYLKFYQDLKALDQIKADKLKKDHQKILGILSSKNQSQTEILSWLEAWIESDGGHPLLNPYLDQLDIDSVITVLVKKQEIDDLAELQQRAESLSLFPYEFWDQYDTSIWKTVPEEMDQTNPDEVVFDMHGIAMIKIRGGSFEMKLDHTNNPYTSRIDIHPTQVHLKSFYVSKSEITVGQYQKCIDVGECSVPDRGYHCNLDDDEGQGPNTPMNCVSWQQARTFAKWVGGDLPSESQWLYVAISQGKNIQYPWGNEPDLSCDLAVISKKNYEFACGHRRSWEVCSKTLGNTQQGVCDMLGNVREWVLDEVDEYYYKDHQSEKTKLTIFPKDGSPICQTQTCDTPRKTHIERGGDYEDIESGSNRLNNHKFQIGKSNHNADRPKEGFRIVRFVDQ